MKTPSEQAVEEFANRMIAEYGSGTCRLDFLFKKTYLAGDANGAAREKAIQELTPGQAEEIAGLCWKHGLKKDLISVISRYEILKCLFIHCQNRDEWQGKFFKEKARAEKLVEAAQDAVGMHIKMYGHLDSQSLIAIKLLNEAIQEYKSQEEKE